MMNKKKLIEEIISALSEDLNAIKEFAKSAHEAATHAESKAEDKYDTRGLEASYLAGAQALRAAELERLISSFKFFPLREFMPGEPIEPGAIAELELNGKNSYYFMVAQGGGLILQFEGKAVQVITAKSPLGEALLGAKAGETVEVEGKSFVREYKVVQVL
jgi:transcription elongation GreA/GreB family factor